MPAAGWGRRAMRGGWPVLHAVPQQSAFAACRPLESAVGTSRLAAASLRQNTLGSCDLTVSEVCLGTMTFGSQTPAAEAHRQLNMAREAGVNFLDTAEIYPVSPTRETANATSIIIGSWLRNQPRDQLVVATKVAGRSDGTDGMTWVPANRSDPPGPDSACVLDGPSIIAAAEAELRRLGTDYIDLFQLHWPDRYTPGFGTFRYDASEEYPTTPFEEQVAAIGQLLQQGKIRHWGISNETPFGVMSHCLAADRLGVPRPITIQNSFSLLHRDFEGALAEVCAPSNFNLGLLPWSALCGGALTGKYLEGYPEGARLTLWPDRYARFHTLRAMAAVRQYVAIAKEAGLSPVQLAYGFCRSRPFIPATIIGASTAEQLVHNLTAFGVPLSEDVLAAVDAVHLRHREPTLQD